MSQNDFTLANQAFPAFRADLNTALQALATNNSGATAPSTTFANMWWYDTDTNIMYIRNEDNDAWIKFAELDQTNDKFVLSGTLQLDDGTVSAPALTFNSDTNMGLYRGGTDILKFVTAGTDRVTITADGNVGINVATGNSSNNGSLTIGHAGITKITGSASGNADELILIGANASANVGMSIISNNSNQGIIYFGDEDDTDIGGIIYNHNGNYLALQTNTAEALRIDTSQRVMIGTTAEGNASADDLTVASTGNTGITIRSGTSNSGAIYFSDATSGDAEFRGFINYAQGSDALSFATASTERMRILSDGGLCINRTDQANDERLAITGNTSSQCMSLTSPITGAYDMMSIINGNGQVGKIGTNGSATQFTTSSDYRLKENVTTSWDATTRLKQLKPSRFNFKTDADTTVDGFLAHEVSSIVPEAITGTKDAVDADGNPIMQGIDQSKIVPLLVKTIQELEARIATLEGA